MSLHIYVDMALVKTTLPVLFAHAKKHRHRGAPSIFEFRAVDMTKGAHCSHAYLPSTYSGAHHEHGEYQLCRRIVLLGDAQPWGGDEIFPFKH